MNQTPTQSNSPTQRTVELERTVHRLDQGVVRTRFVLHPDQVRVARTIDEIDGPVRSISSLFALDTGKTGDLVITRELALTTLARFPEGVLVKDFCQTLIDDGKSTYTVDEIQARIFAMLKREVQRGTVEPEIGKGKFRKLTAEGVLQAKSFEEKMKRETKTRAKAIASKQEDHHQGRCTLVNSAFDFGHKVKTGLINSLPATSFQN